MTATRTTTGCWTCRIRRKKCDDVQPFCGPCNFHQLTCHGYGPKPAWIDGAKNQKAEVERIKQSVSENLRSRRAFRVSEKLGGQSRVVQAATVTLKRRSSHSNISADAPRALQSDSLQESEQAAYPFAFRPDAPPTDNEHDFAVMTSTTPKPSQLLHYLLPYRVLICKECRYAIQPSAISRHLKDLHRIYRSDRREFMEYAQSLDLADPGDIILPEPNEAPVHFLPTASGFACTASGCSHLCVTIQRMKRHWAMVHSDVVANTAQWYPVDLQTFFRGNQLRYFMVCRNSTATSQPERNSTLDSKASSLEVDPLEAPLAYDSDWRAFDLDLLEHFKNSTYLDVGHNSASRRLWQTTIPLLACSHSFLMHGILACSALHLAYLNPTESEQYQLIAAYHQNRALPAFRSAIANANKDTCNALFSFSQLLIIYCFASEGQSGDLLLVREKDELGLPDWLHIIRGNCTIFKTIWKFIENGPLTPLKMERIDGEHLSPVPENPQYARRLSGLLAAISFPGKNRIAQQVIEAPPSPLPDALLELSRAFSKAHVARSRSVFTIWTALYIWPAQVSQDYLDLLKDRDPAALILLAHYCILLEPLDSHWYMSGSSKRLLSRIYNQLDQEWRQWLHWPLEEIGLQL
jgi:hypothetical protein